MFKREKKKLNLFITILISIVIIILIVAGIRSFENHKHRIVTKEYSNKVLLSSKDDSIEITALYYAPNKDGIMQNLTLTVKKQKEISRYDMVISQSGSGARFVDEKDALVFWEHQGEFTLSHANKVVATFYENRGSSQNTNSEF